MQKATNEWEYEKIKITLFAVEGYGEIEIYFSHTESLILISIPAWHWSYLWPLSDEDTVEDDQEHKEQLIKALSIPLSLEDAKDLTNRIEDHLYYKN